MTPKPLSVHMAKSSPTPYDDKKRGAPMHAKNTIALILLAGLVCAGNRAEGRAPPHPLITKYKFRTVDAYLTAFWVPKSRKQKTVTEAEVILMDRKLARACKRKTRSTCKALASVIHQGNKTGPQPLRISSYPRNRWNYGKEYHQMMAAAKKHTGADLRKRLYRWLAKKVPRKRLKKNPSPSLDAHLYQSANIGHEPPFGTLKPIKVVIIEVYTAAWSTPTLYVLDLKI